MDVVDVGSFLLVLDFSPVCCTRPLVSGRSFLAEMAGWLSCLSIRAVLSVCCVVPPSARDTSSVCRCPIRWGGDQRTEATRHKEKCQTVPNSKKKRKTNKQKGKIPTKKTANLQPKETKEENNQPNKKNMMVLSSLQAFPEFFVPFPLVLFYFFRSIPFLSSSFVFP